MTADVHHAAAGTPAAGPPDAGPERGPVEAGCRVRDPRTDGPFDDAVFLRSVLAASNDCIKVLDLDGRLLFMSDGGQRVMEVGDFEAIRGCPWPDLWDGAGHAEALAAVARAKAGGVARFRGPARTMAGTPRRWDVQVSPILGPDGRPEKLLSISRDVTEAWAAQERLDLALDAGTVAGTWVWEIPEDRLSGDRRFARSFSLDPDRLASGVPLGEVVGSIHPEDLPRVQELIALAVAGGGPYSAEYRVRQGDGSWRWIEANGHCEMDGDGRASRFPGVLFDIDRRKRHELRQQALLDLGEALRDLRSTTDVGAMAHAAARTLGQALQVGRAGYGRVDVVGGFVTVDRDWCGNPTIGSIAGRHRFEDYGTYIADLARGETVSIPDVELDPRTRGGTGRLGKSDVRALLAVPLMQDGRLVALLFLDDATPRSWTDDEIAFARTVGDRTWAAKEQAAAEARLLGLNETLEAQVAERTRERDRAWRLSQDLLVVAERDGTISAVNASWTRLLGWSERELVGLAFPEFTHPGDLDATLEAFAGMCEAPLTQAYEYRLRHKDGTYRWFAWTGAFEDGRVYAAGRNTTVEREQAEALRQSQKMEAVGQLTGGLAHDFNNLLTGITGGLDLLQIRIAQGRTAEVGRYIDMAQGAAKRAAALTHRLLAFSRRQTLTPRATDVNRLATGMEDLIRRTVGPAIAVETVLSGGLWNTLVDPSQLENALLNLCINARDAMPDGGRIVVETGNLALDGGHALAGDVPPGPYVTLTVGDDGVGMPPDVVARAFDPFFTTKPIGQGTGLGLSMIYGFARQSGGRVRISSEVGRGTRVCLYLPRYSGDEDPDEATAGPGDLPRARQGEAVLVVDDEASIRMLVADVLDDLGYRALEAEDGPAGLKVLRGASRVDLLVTDVGLPGGMNGRQVADAARALRPGLKVLFITGYAENAVLGDGHLDPGMHVLTKPFAVEALASRIRAIIEGG